MKKRTPRTIINPLQIVAAKTKLTPAERVDFELPLWIALARLDDGRGTSDDTKTMTRHMVMLQIIAADRQNRALYDYTKQAIEKWLAALEAARDLSRPVQFSTQTRKLVVGIANRWSMVLEQVDLGLLHGTAARWDTLAANFGCEP